MRKGYEMVFRHLAHTEVPRTLLGSIMLRITRERQSCARRRVVFLTFSALGACAALVPALRYVGQELSQSGFYEYFSLAFSDGEILLASWKEFALLLAESLPLMGITLVFVALFALFASLRYIARDWIPAFTEMTQIL